MSAQPSQPPLHPFAQSAMAVATEHAVDALTHLESFKLRLRHFSWDESADIHLDEAAKSIQLAKQARRAAQITQQIHADLSAKKGEDNGAQR